MQFDNERQIAMLCLSITRRVMGEDPYDAPYQKRKAYTQEKLAKKQSEAARKKSEE